jgi:hypothetical protein
MGRKVSEKGYFIPDYSKLIPEHNRGAMERYVEDRCQPGSFLTAVLSNDLVGAVSCADSMNTVHLVDVVKWVYNELPGLCWGSREKVRKWLQGGEPTANNLGHEIQGGGKGR